MKRIQPSRGNHFNAMHLGDTSVFQSNFPVDITDREVRDAIRDIPLLADSSLIIQGASEEFETDDNGGQIPLQPHSTMLSIETLEDRAESRAMSSRQLLLSALTDGMRLETAKLLFDRDEGSIRDLSLVIEGRLGHRRDVVELHGVTNEPDGDIYEITIPRATDEESFLIDADAANTFVHALREVQAADNLPDIGLQAGLLSLLDKSASYTHRQFGNYTIEDDNLSLSIERLRRIQGALSHTCSLSFSLQQSATTETIRNFSFTITDEKAYCADLSMVIKDLDSHAGKAIEANQLTRTRQFERFSLHLREHPGILFSALHHALDRLVVFD